MRLRINRLSPVLGAEITGLEVTEPMSRDIFTQIRHGLRQHGGVLVLRDQHLSPAQHIQFSRRFGELFGDQEHLKYQFQDTVKKYLLPGHPQIFRVSNKIVGGEQQGRSRAGNYWHSDVSFRKHPASFSLLHAIEIPEIGGDTLFCNMNAAFEALSNSLQDFLLSLSARHDFAVNTTVGFSHETISKKDLSGQNTTVHPVVRTHPKSGRKSLFVNPGNTSNIIELSPKESRHLLDFLYTHSTQPEFVFRHRWETNDLLIWDNRCTMHYAIVDYTDDRYMHRTTVIGEEPV